MLEYFLQLFLTKLSEKKRKKKRERGTLVVITITTMINKFLLLENIFMQIEIEIEIQCALFNIEKEEKKATTSMMILHKPHH